MLSSFCKLSAVVLGEDILSSVEEAPQIQSPNLRLVRLCNHASSQICRIHQTPGTVIQVLILRGAAAVHAKLIAACYM